MGQHLDALKAKTAALKNTSSGEALTDFLAALDQLWGLDDENRLLVRAAVDEFLSTNAEKYLARQREAGLTPRFLQKRDDAGRP